MLSEGLAVSFLVTRLGNKAINKNICLLTHARNFTKGLKGNGESIPHLKQYFSTPVLVRSYLNSIRIHDFTNPIFLIKGQKPCLQMGLSPPTCGWHISVPHTEDHMDPSRELTSHQQLQSLRPKRRFSKSLRGNVSQVTEQRHQKESSLFGDFLTSEGQAITRSLL